jgi:hypothetical protein
MIPIGRKWLSAETPYLMQSGDANLRGWAIIQFQRTFAKYCATVKEMSSANSFNYCRRTHF